jgi:hypothetical protein
MYLNLATSNDGCLNYIWNFTSLRLALGLPALTSSRMHHSFPGTATCLHWTSWCRAMSFCFFHILITDVWHCQACFLNLPFRWEVKWYLTVLLIIFFPNYSRDWTASWYLLTIWPFHLFCPSFSGERGHFPYWLVGVHYVFQASRPLSRVCIRDVYFQCVPCLSGCWCLSFNQMFFNFNAPKLVSF